MLYPMLISKIHRATVTEANLDYEGSITIDENLLSRCKIPEFAQVHIYNITNGSRFETYTIKGEAGSRIICINGAAAHLAKEGDMVIIAFYAMLDEKEMKKHKPILLLVDEENREKKISS